MQSKFVIIALCLGMASAAKWMADNPVKPKGFEDKVGCYIKEINDVIPYGTMITPIGYCYRIHCRPMIGYVSCGKVATNNENCYVTEKDLSKPYPECCPTIKCHDENKID